jgi:hypothetical protein
MQDLTEELELPHQWAEDLDNGALPPDITTALEHGMLPGTLGKLAVRLGIQEWPHGAEHHLKAHLDELLGEVLVKGAETLGKPLLPPPPAEPFDSLRGRRDHEWSEPLAPDTPLWIALAKGYSRRFGVEFRLTVQINAKWGVASQHSLTPRQLLTEFGFDPAQYSLYPAHSADLLPPDQPLDLHRGERFEAQKDGKYGFAPAPPRGLQTLDQDVDATKAAGVDARRFTAGGQTYVEVRGLEVPSPPWSGSQANILIAAPAAYPNGGLDAFYLEQGINQGGSVPYQQSTVTIDGRTWGLISWHYADGKGWNPSRDDLASHIAHCRGFFLKRGLK